MVKNELIIKMKKELIYLGLTLVGGIIVFKILFYNESIINVIRTITSLFWLFVIPGFALMYYWHEKLEFVERLVIGTVLGIAVIGIASYYIALIGFNVKYHWLLPFIFLLAAGIILWKK